MSWPALLDDPGPSVPGTVYVSRGRVPQYFERHNYSGQAWKVGNEYTTYCPNRSRSYKSTSRLRFKSQDDFTSLMQHCEALKLRPPISYADLFFQQVRLQSFPRYTWIAPFRRFSFGGWEQALYQGEYRGKVHYYDINSAYRWAGQTGLPDTRSFERSDNFSDPVGVYIVLLKAGAIPYAPRAGLHMVTSEERDMLDLRPEKVLLGVRINKLTDCVKEAFQALEQKWPQKYIKPMARSYWGKFNTRLGPKQFSWKNGPKENQQSNFFFNPIWSAFITSRVKLRLNHWRRIALHVYVDSILTKEELPIGEEVGEYRLLEESTDGCYIHSSSRWKFGPNPPRTWPKNTYLGGHNGEGIESERAA